MTEEVKFVPYEVAKKIVSEIVDEEHLHEANRRIMTVYDIDGQELCWFDTEEIIAELGITKPNTDEAKEAAVEYAFHHIPVWSVEELLRKMENK
ncbi:MAG: hypothetical protein ABFQ82_05895 [Thermodesulfobacteriota bacterium]